MRLRLLPPPGPMIYPRHPSAGHVEPAPAPVPGAPLRNSREPGVRRLTRNSLVKGADRHNRPQADDLPAVLAACRDCCPSRETVATLATETVVASVRTGVPLLDAP